MIGKVLEFKKPAKVVFGMYEYECPKCQFSVTTHGEFKQLRMEHQCNPEPTNETPTSGTAAQTIDG